VITCKLAICAQMVLLDAQTNSVSLINIADDLTVPLPGLLASLAAVFFVHRERSDPDKIDAFISAGMVTQEQVRFPHHVDFQGKLNTRLIVQMAGVPIPVPGKFHIGLKLGIPEIEIGAWDFDVTALGQMTHITTSPQS